MKKFDFNNNKKKKIVAIIIKQKKLKNNNNNQPVAEILIHRFAKKYTSKGFGFTEKACRGGGIRCYGRVEKKESIVCSDGITLAVSVFPIMRQL